METQAILSFDNTKTAFAYKSNTELKEAYRLFSLMANSWLVTLGTALTPWAIKSGLPVKGVIRKTIFKQFVGGESLQEVTGVAQKLAKYNVQVILDYGVEGKESEEEFDKAKDEFIRVINYASTQPNIPYMSVKVTGLARHSLLEKLHALMQTTEALPLIKRYDRAIQQLSNEELNEWQKVHQRVRSICDISSEKNIGMMIDAEESWVQDPVDAITMLMMKEYNKGRLVIFNTIQLYRHDRLEFLKKSEEAAREHNFTLGVKLVRGAYMEKERERATEKGYTSPIQTDKTATDEDYNKAVKFCIQNIDHVGVVIASHNEYSNMLAVKLMEQKGLPFDHPYVHFSQLYGMSDHITFNLALAGCAVSKYLPFGPIEDVVPYLMRRAEENTSVKGQTSRELNLIKKEIERRGM
ncbi:proline dehydrogenase family protein [Chitinophagaceae bacterium LB-8]|uniref:Proline dehydrogenase family protein n=1 Tax=Paraflavisolibacter caeni TaxID=2982496 RepID=A0A9X3B8C8_9BACT|nr:proline dehydrogenase family protein [Paraflavisolibacter caeni]MCU7550565.1 proline dehydrogenase family protein [Paraflavisolibacter caeni]